MIQKITKKEWAYKKFKLKSARLNEIYRLRHQVLLALNLDCRACNLKKSLLNNASRFLHSKEYIHKQG